jgi:fucose 4-O-acetylase-like acetyltransferase
MLVAATRGSVKRTAPPLETEPHALEVAPIGPRIAEPTRDVEPVAQVSPAAHAGRPRGVKFLVAYCILLGICAVASISFMSSLLDAFRQLPLSAVGITLPDLTYLWGLLVLLAFLDFVVAFGLLKRMRRVRKITRALSIAAVVCALTVICLTAVLLASPTLLGAQTVTSLQDSAATMLYGTLAAGAVLGIAVPLVVFRYLGRPNVKEYFEIVE